MAIKFSALPVDLFNRLRQANRGGGRQMTPLKIKVQIKITYFILFGKRGFF